MQAHTDQRAFRRGVRLLLPLLFLAIPFHPAHAENICPNHIKDAGPCFTVKGRIEAYNGRPTFRIFPDHSNRILGIASNDREEPLMPASLRKIAGFDRPVTGTFKVCPVTKKRPGRMQMVCIETEDTVPKSF